MAEQKQKYGENPKMRVHWVQEESARRRTQRWDGAGHPDYVDASHDDDTFVWSWIVLIKNQIQYKNKKPEQSDFLFGKK